MMPRRVSLAAQWYRIHLQCRRCRFVLPGHKYSLEKEMAAHSSIPAWRIPWTEEPGDELQSMGSQRVGHDWATDALTSSGVGFVCCFPYSTHSGVRHVVSAPILSLSPLLLIRWITSATVVCLRGLWPRPSPARAVNLRFGCLFTVCSLCLGRLALHPPRVSLLQWTSACP